MIFSQNLRIVSLNIIHWQAIYFTEELKLAQKVGYKVEPVRALLFERHKSPLTDFVNSVYGLRRTANKKGQRSAQTVYKMILNSLYGRFGMSSDSTVTVIGTMSDVDFYRDYYGIQSVIQLSKTLYAITYKQHFQPMVGLDKETQGTQYSAERYC